MSASPPPIVRLFLAAALLATALLAPGCRSGDDRAAAAARGAEALRPFKASLMGALKAGLAEGPVAAVEACHLAAPGLPAAASTEGVTVGRTSSKLRNPANAPKPWMKPLLDEYAAAGPGAPPRVVPLDGDRVGYVEPIGVQPMCLTCHGESLAPEVAAVIAERYPRDEATGYTEGQLRGLFWVELDAR